MIGLHTSTPKIVLFLGLLSLGYACKTDKRPEAKTTQDIAIKTTTPSKKLGMNYTKSKRTFSETYTTLRTILDANPNIGIMAEVDHADNASKVSLELAPTKIILFGNPNLGTPLMQQNQLAGIDLPQKILIHENDGTVFANYNSVAYLTKRHGLAGIETLPKIKNALAKLSTTAAEANELMEGTANVSLGEGLVTKKSHRSFDQTYKALELAITNNPKLRIIAQVDHQANAVKVGKELRPTRLIIFGNPNLGTPLMQNARTIALDLPQKMLVWEDKNGHVQVTYNAPEFLMSRHGITENKALIETVSGALNTLSDVAIGN